MRKFSGDLSEFVMNARPLQGATTGVQRYARELDQAWGGGIRHLTPSEKNQHGWRAHAWEQMVIPMKSEGKLLFSPANTGPLAWHRQVVTIHDAATFDCADAFQGAFSRWYRWLLPRLAQRVTGIITVSRFSQERLVAQIGADPARMTVIYNGVTPPPPALSREEVDRLLERWQLPKRFLLFVGSHDPRKNIRRLVEAFTAAELEGVKLVIAGGINERLFSQTSANKASGNIHVLGRVTDPELEALYSRASGFVFPSLYEGFGLPPLEAMARGCPVLCSSASCLPEVCGPSFEQNGACLYFDPLSISSIARAIVRWADLSPDARHRMVDAGYQRTAQFSWQRCAEETMSFLQECAARGKARVPVGELTATSRLTES